MSLAIIMKNRLKELEISAALVFMYLLDTQGMSFISVKLLAIDIICNDGFDSISLPLEWHC